MYCPSCGSPYGEGYRFCMRCGAALKTPAAPTATEIAAVDDTTLMPSSVPPREKVVATSAGESLPATPAEPGLSTRPSGLPVTPSQPTAPTGPLWDSHGSAQALPQAGYGYSPPPPQERHPGRLQGYDAPAAGGQFQTPKYGSTGFSAASIWGPFAGYGARRRHMGWLLDGHGDRADELNQKVNAKFGERQIPGAEVRRSTLTARGLLVENRAYHLVQRGLVTVGLYIARFGQDLYLSLASYLKPPVSNLRIIILGVMVLYWLFVTLVLPTMLNNAMNDVLSSFTGSFLGGGAGSGGSDTLITMLCLLGPLGLVDTVALLLFAVFSIHKFTTEKDFLAGLRVMPNEFNEDDLMALEKAVEQTVRVSMDEIGLDFAKARPAIASETQRLI